MLSASLAAVAATLLLATGGGSSGGEDAPPRVPSAIDVILVDAVVTDRQDRPVTGLGRADFLLREDGVAQSIVRFEAVNVGEASPPPAGATRGSGRSSTNFDEVAGRLPRTSVVVFDDVHLGALDAVAAKEAVVRFLAQSTRPGDRVSLVVPGAGLRWTVSLPEGRDELVQVLGSLEGRRPAHLEMISDYEALRIIEDNDRGMVDLVRQRFQVAGTLPDDDLMTAADSQGGRSLEDEARLRLGRVLRLAGDFEEVEGELAAAVDSSEEGYLTALAHLFWGESREARGDLTAAIQHYEAALDADRDCQPAALALSHALHRSERPREARERPTPALATKEAARRSPWREYHLGLGRRYEAALAGLHQSVPAVAEAAQ